MTQEKQENVVMSIVTSEVNMVIADALSPSWRQGICNHYVDIRRSVWSQSVSVFPVKWCVQERKNRVQTPWRLEKMFALKKCRECIFACYYSSLFISIETPLWYNASPLMSVLVGVIVGVNQPMESGMEMSAILLLFHCVIYRAINTPVNWNSQWFT